MDKLWYQTKRMTIDRLNMVDFKAFMLSEKPA